jgi:hypothetical protein
VKMVEQWTSKHMVVGSTSTTFLNFFSLIHTFIIHSIHKVFPTVVEACIKNSLLQYSIAQSKETPMVKCYPSFELMPLLGPTVEIKLCLV